MKVAGSENELLKKVLGGDRFSVARDLDCREREPDARGILSSVFPYTGRAHRIGVTGPPCAGKSTIANKLVRFYRTQNQRIGIITVDCTFNPRILHV